MLCILISENLSVLPLCFLLAVSAGTNIRIAVSSTRRIAAFDERWCLNLHPQLPGIVAGPINRLVDAIPNPLESRSLSPQINHILPDRNPHIRNVRARINPSGRRVRRDKGVRQIECLGARGSSEVQSTDAHHGLAGIVGIVTISVKALVQVS